VSRSFRLRFAAWAEFSLYFCCSSCSFIPPVVSAHSIQGQAFEAQKHTQFCCSARVGVRLLCPAYSALVRQEQDTPLLCLSTHFDRAHQLMLSQWIQTGLLLSAKVGKLSESRSFSWASKAVPSTAGQLVTSKEGVLWGTLGFPSC
jgi:hypothetical protein